MATIKESMDVLAAVKACAVAIKKAKEDGVVDWKDLLAPETRALVPAMLEAAKDGKLIPAEMKDIDASEMETLLAELAVVSAALVEAVLS